MPYRLGPIFVPPSLSSVWHIRQALALVLPAAASALAISGTDDVQPSGDVAGSPVGPIQLSAFDACAGPPGMRHSVMQNAAATANDIWRLFPGILNMNFSPV